MSSFIFVYVIHFRTHYMAFSTRILFLFLLPASFLFSGLLTVSDERPCIASPDHPTHSPTHILSPLTRLARYRFNAPADFREWRPAPSFCRHARTHGLHRILRAGSPQTPPGQIKKKKDRVMEWNSNSLTLFVNGRIFATRDSCGVGSGWNRPSGGRDVAFWPLLWSLMGEAKCNGAQVRSSCSCTAFPEIGIRRHQNSAHCHCAKLQATPTKWIRLLRCAIGVRFPHGGIIMSPGIAARDRRIQE